MTTPLDRAQKRVLIASLCLVSLALAGARLAPNGVWLGVDQRREAWLPMTQGASFPTRFGATSLGLRWNQRKGWHLALNATSYDVDDDAGALGGSELWVLQQQFVFQGPIDAHARGPGAAP